MPRQPYNTTCDLIWGPSQPEAGEIRETRDCRLVPEIFQDVSTRPLDTRTHYVTMDGDEPVGPSVTVSGGVVTTDYNRADRIAVPSGSAARFVVLFSEYVDQPPPGPYWRVNVGTIDDDDPPVGPPTPEPDSDEYWWRADTIGGLSDGDPVSIWPDFADAGDAVSSGGSRPIYKEAILNGLPVVDFRGGTRSMTVPAVATESITGIAVVRVLVDTAFWELVSGVECDGFVWGAYSAGTGEMAASRGCVDQRLAGSLTSADGWQCIAFRKNEDDYDFWMGGSLVGSGTWVQTFDDGMPYLMGGGLNGSIAELHVWKTALDDMALSAAMSEAMTRWGL